MPFLNVHSEIGRLKTVVLHRPGIELENLTPKWLEELLFDDIPWLDLAVQEHDAFAKVLTDHGVEVLYLADLVAAAREVRDRRLPPLAAAHPVSRLGQRDQLGLARHPVFHVDPGSTGGTGPLDRLANNTHKLTSGNLATHSFAKNESKRMVGSRPRMRDRIAWNE